MNCFYNTLFPITYANIFDLLGFILVIIITDLCRFALMYLLISFRVASLAQGQSYDCLCASEVTLNDMGNIHHYQFTIKHDKTWCVEYLLACNVYHNYIIPDILHWTWETLLRWRSISPIDHNNINIIFLNLSFISQQILSLNNIIWNHSLVTYQTILFEIYHYVKKIRYLLFVLFTSWS